MPRHTATFNGRLPAALAHEATRVLRQWADAPTSFVPPAASAWGAPIIVMDGHSGAGKTTVMADMARTLRVAGLRHFQIAGPDAWYPGWGGMERGTELTLRLLTGSTAPRGHRPPVAPRPARRGTFTWDWERGTWGPYRLLDPTLPLLIEGCGALTPASAAAASLTIWVEAPGGVGERRSRAIARDGVEYEHNWEVWARQEERHVAAHHPRSLADWVVLNG